jgi:hypothetical protein
MDSEYTRVVIGATLLIGGCDSVVLRLLDSLDRSPPAFPKYAIGLGVEHEVDMDCVLSGTHEKV